jgi:hypothetical protein
MPTHEEDREEKKQTLLRLLRIYTEETPRGAFITRKEFNEYVVEANIGVSRPTQDSWWHAFHAWRILIDTKGKTVINPDYLRAPEEKLAAPLGQPSRGSAHE